MALVDHDHIIQTLTPNGSDKALHIGTLPRRARCAEDLLDSQTFDSPSKYIAIDTVPIALEIPGRFIERERLSDLLGSPGRRRMLGNIKAAARAAGPRSSRAHGRWPSAP